MWRGFGSLLKSIACFCHQSCLGIFLAVNSAVPFCLASWTSVSLLAFIIGFRSLLSIFAFYLCFLFLQSSFALCSFASCKFTVPLKVDLGFAAVSLVCLSAMLLPYAPAL
jgi:hypothetical protein